MIAGHGIQIFVLVHAGTKPRAHHATGSTRFVNRVGAPNPHVKVTRRGTLRAGLHHLNRFTQLEHCRGGALEDGRVRTTLLKHAIDHRSDCKDQ